LTTTGNNTITLLEEMNIQQSKPVYGQDIPLEEKASATNKNFMESTAIAVFK